MSFKSGTIVPMHRTDYNPKHRILGGQNVLAGPVIFKFVPWRSTLIYIQILSFVFGIFPSYLC